MIQALILAGGVHAMEGMETTHSNEPITGPKVTYDLFSEDQNDLDEGYSLNW